MSAERLLRASRAPDEAGAEERAWNVVHSAYVERARVPVARRRNWRLVVSVALAVMIGAVALSPAGATVGGLLTRALGVQHAAPALYSLPAPGRLLLSGSAGTWIVAGDGAMRRLGPWRQASWSPHGLFVAVVGGDRLLAVDPHGTLRWSLARPAIVDPSWYPPLGYRIAYRSGAEVRVVAGDGTGDHALAEGVARVAPAWRPGYAYELAYLTARGRLIVREADSATVVWSVAAPHATHKLVWSADGSRLLALGRGRAFVYGARGARIATLDSAAADGSLSPDGRSVALVRGGEASVVARLAAARVSFRRVLSGADLGSLAWSPDGRWLLVSWPSANQWVFVHVAGRPRIVAFSRIRQQFAMRGPTAAFPQLEGWCCTSQGTPG